MGQAGEDILNNNDLTLETIIDYANAVNDNFYNSDVVNLKGNGVLLQSDLHRQYQPLEAALYYSQENDLVLSYDGDLFNEYEFEKHAYMVGRSNPKQLTLDYLQTKISQKDFEALVTIEQIGQMGLNLEEYISLWTQQTGKSVDEVEAERSRLENMLTRTQSEIFVKRVNKTVEDFRNNNKQMLLENQLAREELYFEMMDIQAKEAADVFNNYSDVPVAVTSGNHETRLYWDLVKKYLDNKDQLVQVDRIGAASVISETGKEINIGGLTSCLGQIPGVANELNPQIAQFLYGHLLDQDPNKHYDRIMGAGIPIHILQSHGQIGAVNISDGKEGHNVSQDPNAVALSSEIKANNGLIQEGHIHKTYDFVNSYGVRTLRSIGNEVYEVIRNDEGELEAKLIKLNAEYTGSHADPLGYDYSILIKRVDERLEKRLELEAKLKQQEASNDDSFEDQQNAA